MSKLTENPGGAAVAAVAAMRHNIPLNFNAIVYAAEVRRVTIFIAAKIKSLFVTTTRRFSTAGENKKNDNGEPHADFLRGASSISKNEKRLSKNRRM